MTSTTDYTDVVGMKLYCGAGPNVVPYSKKVLKKLYLNRGRE